MRLSAPGFDEERAILAIHAALDAGVRWLDTADVYAPSDDQVGHNERLIRRALEGWNGPQDRVLVATKGGLVRHGTRWRPDGRAGHLRAASEASRTRLGRETLDIYFLHVADPSVPIETSVRALAGLQRAGTIRSIGLSNVTVEQIRMARAIAPIDWVQVELGIRCADHFESGVAEYCRDEGLGLVAHRPLGGEKGLKGIRKDTLLKRIAKRLGAGAEDVALAWLYDLPAKMVAIPGATRPETAQRAASAAELVFTVEERAELDERFAHGRLLRVPRSQRAPAREASGDVVIIMGSQGAGKSTLAETYVSRGYLRLNRDERGGRLVGLLEPLRASLRAGRTHVVLDNTYPCRKDRNQVIETAWQCGVPVRCEWVTTPLEEAQLNVVERMLDRHQRLLDTEGLRKLKSGHGNDIPPRVLFRYREQLEPPHLSEGFIRIDERPFVRTMHPGRPAVIVDADAYLLEADLRPKKVPIDLKALAERTGATICAVSWQPQISRGERNHEDIEEAARALHRHLGLTIDLVYCPHPPGPPICWCRRPLPGLGAVLKRKHGLDLSRSVFLARGPANQGFANYFGMSLVEPSDLQSWQPPC